MAAPAANLDATLTTNAAQVVHKDDFALPDGFHVLCIPCERFPVAEPTCPKAAYLRAPLVDAPVRARRTREIDNYAWRGQRDRSFNVSAVDRIENS